MTSLETPAPVPPTPEGLRSAVTLGSPLEQLREGRLTRRLVQLQVGLVVYGVSLALMIRAELGLDPWDVLHHGVVLRTGLSFGTVLIVTALVVLLAWIPLRQWPGVGTISNAVVIGVSVDVALAMIEVPSAMAVRVGYMVTAVVLNAIATATYVGVRLGPGPRDGLMTGLVTRTGRSVRLVRTALELTVLAVGWLLGGAIGVGTLLYAFGIGPLTQLFLPWFTVMPRILPDAPPPSTPT